MVLLDALKDVNGDLGEMSELMKLLIAITIIGGLLPIAIKIFKTNNLSGKFKSLGNMTGMMKEDIIKQVGLPNATTVIAGGQLLQWSSTGYHISIKFTNEGLFMGIMSEHAA